MELWHPYRWQTSPALRRASIFEYYGAEPVFQVRTLKNVDVVRWERRLPAPLFSAVGNFRHQAWGAYAAGSARRAAPDLAFTRDVPVAFWLSALGVPTILELHRVPRRAGRLLLRRMVRRRQLLVVPLTRATHDELVGLGADPSRMLVLGGAVDVDAFGDVPPASACRGRLALPPDRAVIGYVGRFEALGQDKGVAELVRALPLVKSDGPPPLLVCVGGPMDHVGRYLDMGRAAGAAEGQLRFVDHVPHGEVPFWLGAFDVAVMPFPGPDAYALAPYMSPMKMFEYMAAGLPIVATDLPAVREVLRHGENGWLVPPGDVQALADGITAVLSDPSLRRSLGQAAGIAARRHTWQGRAEAVARFSEALF